MSALALSKTGLNEFRNTETGTRCWVVWEQKLWVAKLVSAVDVKHHFTSDDSEMVGWCLLYCAEVVND